MAAEQDERGHPPAWEDAALGSGPAVPDSTAAIQARLALLTDQVDALQVATSRRSRPWYREASLLVSAAAVLISLIFSALGLRQVSVKDVADKQEALRQTVVRILDSQTEMTQVDRQNSGDPLMARWARGNLNAKRQVLIDTALALVRQLGRAVEASSLLPLAGQLQVDGRYEEALALYRQALELGQSPVVRSSILRAIGGTYRMPGSTLYDVAQSRDYMQQAADLFKDQSDDAGRFYRADNLLFWAELERTDGDTAMAATLFDQATAAAESIAAANPSRQMILSQIDQARANQAVSGQAAIDLRGEWQVRYPDDPARQGSARIVYDAASGAYYVTLLILRDGAVHENRTGTATMPDPATVVVQWQGSRYSQQYGMPVQASGVLDLEIEPGGLGLSGVDSAVGEPQAAIRLTR